MFLQEFISCYISFGIEVLASIDFRMDRANGAHCDSHFTIDVMKAGYSMMADFRVICGHKDEKGTILWPEL